MKICDVVLIKINREEIRLTGDKREVRLLGPESRLQWMDESSDRLRKALDASAQVLTQKMFLPGQSVFRTWDWTEWEALFRLDGQIQKRNSLKLDS